MLFQDLNEDDVMVLDSGDEVYVWIGKGASDEEKEKSWAMAKVSSENHQNKVELILYKKLQLGESVLNF